MFFYINCVSGFTDRAVSLFLVFLGGEKDHYPRLVDRMPLISLSDVYRSEVLVS